MEELKGEFPPVVENGDASRKQQNSDHSGGGNGGDGFGLFCKARISNLKHKRRIDERENGCKVGESEIC